MFAFRVFLKVTHFDRHLKPGTYTLRVHEWPTVVVRKLTLGLNDDLKLTIPEGFRASQIAERLAADGIADANDFEAYVKLRKLEGRLFPSTYHFPPGYGVERTAAKMTEAFDQGGDRRGFYAAANPKPWLDLEQTLDPRVHRRARGRASSGASDHRRRLPQPSGRSTCSFQADPDRPIRARLLETGQLTLEAGA